jgi:hypothetical protein
MDGSCSTNEARNRPWRLIDNGSQMAVSSSALRTRRILLPRNIIISNAASTQLCSKLVVYCSK